MLLQAEVSRLTEASEASTAREASEVFFCQRFLVLFLWFAGRAAGEHRPAEGIGVLGVGCCGLHLDSSLHRVLHMEADFTRDLDTERTRCQAPCVAGRQL